MDQLLEPPKVETSLTDEEWKRLKPLYREKYSHLNLHQFEYFIGLTKELRVSPWMKCLQAKLVPGVKGKDEVNIVLPIEGYRSLAARSRRYCGLTDGVHAFDDSGRLISSTVTVFRHVCGKKRKFPATAQYAEYAPGALASYRDQYTTQWLDKCAEALALRKAFPEYYIGAHAVEEFEKLAAVLPPGKSGAEAGGDPQWVDDVPEFRPDGDQ